ncbi:hypothetical protein Tco_1107992 [Tanacetum coccineum]
MGTIDDMKSILTQSALDALCEKFHIPNTVHPELPGRNHRICDSPAVCDFFATHPALFQKFPESFLCLVGISRYYELDENVYPVLLADDDEFDHAAANDQRGANIHGVVNEEVTVDVQEQLVNVGIVRIEDEVSVIVAEKARESRKKRKDTRGASGSSLPPKKLRADHGTSSVGASTSGKSVAALQGLLERSTLPVEVGVATVTTVPFVTSSVTPTPEREGEGATDYWSSAPDPLIMTTAVATMVVSDISSISVPRVSNKPVYHTLFAYSASIGETDPDVTGPSYPAGTELSSDTFFMVQDMDAETLQQRYVSKWTVINDYALDDPDVFHSLVDHLAPPVIFSQLHSIDYDKLLAEFNVRVARQTCVSSKVKLRLEHDLRDKKMLEGKSATQAGWLREKDAKIASLKAQLSLKEAEAVKAIRLHGQVATVEAAETAQLSCDELSVKAASLEFEKDKLVDQVSTLETTYSGIRDQVSGYDLFKKQIEAIQDEQVKLDGDGFLAAHEDGLAAGIENGKAGRGLIDIAAYDPSTKANSVSTVNALHTVDFPLLSQLESKKDASIDDIMGLLCLEGPGAETPEADQLQPSHEQLMHPIHQIEDLVVIRETLLSFCLDVVHALVQRIRGYAKSRRMSLSNAIIPLIEPLSAENLVGEASTSGVSATATTTALSTTFVQVSTVPPISMVDYEVLSTGPSTIVPSPSKIVFEKEELETTSEHTTTN